MFCHVNTYFFQDSNQILLFFKALTYLELSAVLVNISVFTLQALNEEHIISLFPFCSYYNLEFTYLYFISFYSLPLNILHAYFN